MAMTASDDNMLAPLMDIEFVPICCLRVEGIFNFRNWPVHSADKWLRVLESQFSSGSVTFWRAGQEIEFDRADIRRQLEHGRPRNRQSSISVRFTEEGGLQWENRIGVDWDYFFSITVQETFRVVEVTFCSLHAVSLFEAAGYLKADSLTTTLVPNFHPYHWRSFPYAVRIEYKLSEQEMRRFLDNVVIRSRRPFIASLM